MAAAIAFAAANAQGIYGMKALAGGHFIKEAHQSFHYVLGLEGMHALAVGMLSKEEIKANFTLFNSGQADVASWEDLEKRKRKIRSWRSFANAVAPVCQPVPIRGSI